MRLTRLDQITLRTGVARATNCATAPNWWHICRAVALWPLAQLTAFRRMILRIYFSANDLFVLANAQHHIINIHRQPSIISKKSPANIPLSASLPTVCGGRTWGRLSHSNWRMEWRIWYKQFTCDLNVSDSRLDGAGYHVPLYLQMYTWISTHIPIYKCVIDWLIPPYIL